jgi:lipoprotein-anchoring transpeptidase ErfK/SrfK
MPLVRKSFSLNFSVLTHQISRRAMKSIICPALKSRPVALFASAVLTLTAMSAWVKPALTQPQGAIISSKMQELQQSDQRWIQIDLTKQRLIAWEGSKPVYAIVVSTGKRSTPTRIGTFAIKSKHRYNRMRGEGYDVPNVPYTMYYYGGYAIHGAYWHRRFGTPVSHGCINLAVNHSKWLYNWASVGTPVVVHK